jgi:hypothetical protein
MSETGDKTSEEKSANKVEQPASTDNGASSESKPDKPSDDGIPEAVKKYINEALSAALGKTDGRRRDSSDGDSPRFGGYRSQREEEAADAIRREAQRLLEADENKKKVDKLEKMVAEVLPKEKPQAGKLQRLLWGE